MTAPNGATTYGSCSNGTGRLCSVATASKTETYAYDAFGNITDHQGVGYTHDGDDRLETITYPSGAVVTYSYDSSGRVSQVDLSADGQSRTLVSNIDYLPFGPMTGLDYGNGKQLSESHDLQYRITAQAIPGLLDFGYGYDPAGNITSRTDTIDGDSTFGYDDLNRLDTADGPFGSRDYGYDGNGNRTGLTDGGGTTSYTYVPGSNRLATETGWLHTLDANGNHSERLEDSGSGLGLYYTYNQNHRLIQVTERTAPSTDVVLGDYDYNGLGQRSWSTVTRPGSSTGSRVNCWRRWMGPALSSGSMCI